MIGKILTFLRLWWGKPRAVAIPEDMSIVEKPSMLSFETGWGASVEFELTEGPRFHTWLREVALPAPRFRVPKMVIVVPLSTAEMSV